MFEYYRVENLINEPSSFWLSLLVAFLGTGLGFLGAYYLTKVAERRQNERDKYIKQDLYNDRLVYMSQLIETCVDIIKKQIGKFEKLSAEIEKVPTEQHLLELIASNDLQRLQKMDTEEVFHAYHSIIPDSQEKIADYKNIYSSIDFLYMELKQSIDSVDKQVNFVYRDQLYIKDKIESLSTEIIKWIKDIEVKEGNYASLPEYHFLTSFHDVYQKLIDEKAQLGKIESNFLLPFGVELAKTYSRAPFFNDLHTLATQAGIRFNHVRLNATEFAKQLKGIRKRIETSLEKLEKINDKIKTTTSIIKQTPRP